MNQDQNKKLDKLTPEEKQQILKDQKAKAKQIDDDDIKRIIENMSSNRMI